MTRRWPDISKPRGNTSTNVAIGAGLGMLAGVIVLVIVGLVVATLFSVRPARAHDSGDNAVTRWRLLAMQETGWLAAVSVRTAAGLVSFVMRRYVRSTEGRCKWVFV